MIENKEIKTFEKLLTFAYAMDENVVGLSKGEYDENQFIKNTKEFLNKYYVDRHEVLGLKQALQRLDKYEQILGEGRLTDRNYKNTTLDLDSCKPYLRLGQLEDIYERTKQNG